ncbi:hypothetical protein SDC9_151147 [bioreactor metagenome]|uniref:Uncharacterized protein n=1 Tax=bioreactor metagenome TaxID=1076179 RepID=A0A645ERJ9_9ZZZZ
MRIDVYERERHMPEKRLPREPEHDGRVLSYRPEHTQLVKRCVGLAQDIYAFGFELVEVVHVFVLGFVRHGVYSSLSFCMGIL